MPITGSLPGFRQVILSLLLLSIVQLSAVAQDNLAGDWDGGNWGAVKLSGAGDNDYLGSYSNTYNGQPGLLEFYRKGIYSNSFTGIWKESSATEGHPVRQGTITMTVLSDGSLDLTWQATDSDPSRAPKGTGHWIRK